MGARRHRARHRARTGAGGGPAGGHEHGEELVSRGTQLVGGFLGTVVAAVVFSVVVAAVYAGVRHRLPGRTDVGRVAVLAAIGFGVFALLPALKMPANPPAVGDPDTVGTRTAIYIAVLGAGVVTALLVSALVGTLRARGWHPSAVAAAAVLAGLALVVAPCCWCPTTRTPSAPTCRPGWSGTSGWPRSASSRSCGPPSA